MPHQRLNALSVAVSVAAIVLLAMAACQPKSTRTADAAGRPRMHIASDWTNPIVPGWYADPEGAVFDNRFWVFPTYSAKYDDQSYFDAFSSSDLAHWTKHPRVLERANVPWARRAMVGPRRHRARPSLLLLLQRQRHPERHRSWRHRRRRRRPPQGPTANLLGHPLIDRFHNGAQPIDQFVFLDADGSYWMLYGGWRHCNLARLNNDFTGFTPFPDGTTFKEITPAGYVEGPFLFTRNGWYYFMWSEGGWTGPNYSVAYAMARSIQGPFERIGKVLQQDPTVATGAGHHSIIKRPGSDEHFIVYHRRPLGETDGNHRVVCIDRLEFDPDGKIKPVLMTFRAQ